MASARQAEGSGPAAAPLRAGAPSRSRPWWRDGWTLFLLGATLATCILALCLALRIETVQRLPPWFWPFRPKHLLGPALVLGAAFVAALSLGLLRPWPGRRRTQLLWLAGAIVLGAAWQHGLALAEGRGAEALRYRALGGGHREFIRIGAAPLDARKVIPNYEEFLRDQPNLPFARSKPPGHLLFYMANSRIARPLMPHLWNPPPPPEWSPDEWSLANWLVWLLPLLTYVALVPLVLLARSLLPGALPQGPVLLFLTAPAIGLVTLHLDGALYPLIVLGLWSAAACGARATGARAWIWWALSGVWAWIALFVSFSLLPALPLAVLFAIVVARQRPGGPPVRRLLAGLGVALASCLVLLALSRIAIHFDVRVAFQRALFNHSSAKGWREADRLPAAFYTLTEFAYWLGPALVGLVLWDVASTAAAFLRNRRAAWHEALLSSGVVAFVVATALFSKTFAEVARLWIFLIPAVTLVAAQRLGRVQAEPSPSFWRAHAWQAVLALQVAWTVALKNWQDF